MKTYCMIITACSSLEESNKIADCLLSKKLASCIQRMPIFSTYRWEGKIEKKNEFLLFIKTRSTLYDKVEKTIKAIHSYKVPEIISVDIDKGLSAYLEWIKTETIKD